MTVLTGMGVLAGSFAGGIFQAQKEGVTFEIKAEDATLMEKVVSQVKAMPVDSGRWTLEIKNISKLNDENSKRRVNNASLVGALAGGAVGKVLSKL